MAQQDFTTVLNRFKSNLTEYKATGNSAYKTAIDTDKAWLDAYIGSLQAQSQQQQNAITQFVAKYEQTNPELVQMQKQMKEIQAEGPKVQDLYETEKEATKEEPIDYSTYYVKAGLIVGVGALALLVSSFRPLNTI
jgi:alkyl hydroperoxide reductase subunit AhpF